MVSTTNTKEALVEGRFGRFKDAIWFPKEPTAVLIGGAGGISSWLTLLLSRAGFYPTVYDFDIIEEHNIGGQMFGRKHIGKYKVDALEEVVKMFSDHIITGVNEKYDKDSMTNQYVFAGFDNMLARRDMFSNWANVYSGNPNAIFIDGRLTFEQIQIFCIQGSSEAAIDKYKSEQLFSDSEVADAPCTLRQTSHTAAIIAGHMVGFFTNFLATLAGKESSVPYSWEYLIPADFANSDYTI